MQKLALEACISVSNRVFNSGYVDWTAKQPGWRLTRHEVFSILSVRSGFKEQCAPVNEARAFEVLIAAFQRIIIRMGSKYINEIRDLLETRALNQLIKMRDQ